MVVLELLDEPVDDPLIPVIAPELGVAARRLHLEHAFADLEDGDVESPATQVVDEDELVAVLVEPVGERCRSRLVDDPQHLETRDLAGLGRRLALCVAEVGGHRDDRLGDVLTEELLGVALELHEDAGRDLLRGVLLAVDLGRPVGPHVAFHRTDRPVRVRDRLSLGLLADEDLAVLGERDDGGGGPVTLCVGDDAGIPALEDGEDGVRGPEVDSDGTSHVSSLFDRGGMVSVSAGPKAPGIDVWLSRIAFYNLSESLSYSVFLGVGYAGRHPRGPAQGGTTRP